MSYNDRKVINYLKIGLVVVQLGLLVMLVLTGLEFKNAKTIRDLFQPVRNHPKVSDTSLLFEIDTRFFVLLFIIISLTIKMPVLLVALFTEKIVLFFITAGFTGIAMGLYIFHASHFGDKIFFAESISGIVLAAVSVVLQEWIYKRIKGIPIFSCTA